MRKSFLSLVAVALLIGVLALPAAAGEFPGAESAKIDWKQESGASINVMACSRDAIDYLRSILPEFTALTGIQVTIDDYPEAEFFRKIIIDLASGNPVSDVFLLSHAFAKMYAEAGWMEPIRPFLDNPKLTDAAWYDFADYPEGSLSAVNINGVLYGVPVCPDTQILFYRKDLFQEAGIAVPKTVDELYDAAVKLHNPPERAGIVMRLARGAGTHWPWNGFIENYGGLWIDPKTGRPMLDSKPVIEATEMYIKLLKDAGPAGAVNYSWYEASSDFAQGKAAIFGGDANIFMSFFEDPNRSKVAGKVGYAVFPAAPNGHHSPAAGTAWHWGMSSKADNKEAAWLFMEWATSKDVALRLGVRTTEIMRNSVWNSKTLREEYPNVPDWIEASKETMNRFSADYHFPRVKELGPLADILEATLQEIYLGKMTAEEGMKKAQAETLKAMGLK